MAMTTRHGAYKTPGGKLVAVDFDLTDGKLRNVQVHGDFFLQPDDAQETIRRSLDGAPADLSAEELSQRIAASIPDGVEWLGSSPDALALAVHRGIQTDPGEADAGGGDRGFS
jgi:lipoate-protein ligase A